jgi:plasmid maintenance system antidote protein VapI
MPPPIGPLLRQVVKAQRTSQAKLAAELGVSQKHLSQVAIGHAQLSYDLAIRLEEATGVPAIVWATTDAAYRIELRRQAHAKTRPEEF